MASWAPSPPLGRIPCGDVLFGACRGCHMYMYTGPCQTSKIKLYLIIVNVSKPFTIFTRKAPFQIFDRVLK